MAAERGRGVKPILILEPFFGGSHASWLRGLQSHCSDPIECLTLPASHWKWRMHGGAISLAKRYREWGKNPQHILATDMLDLASFLALTRDLTAEIPVSIFFHENQLTYPQTDQDTDKQNNRDNHYGFINYTSALAADEVIFNSHYHQQSFLEALEVFLSRLPDHQELSNVIDIAAKSRVVPLRLELTELLDGPEPEKGPVPLLLWNHRWEHDKGPECFFECLFQLADDGLDFEVAIVGQRYRKWPKIFDQAQEKLGNRIVQFGPVASRQEYAHWLRKADVIPVTSQQDFFGISLMEALYCNTYPLLPNRLVFPEHLPPEWHAEHLYQDDKDLFQKLKALLQHPKHLKDRNFSSLASKYAWGTNAQSWTNLMAPFPAETPPIL